MLHSHATLQRVMRESAAHWGIVSGEAMIMPSPVTHVSGFANGLELPFVAGNPDGADGELGRGARSS